MGELHVDKPEKREQNVTVTQCAIQRRGPDKEAAQTTGWHSQTQFNLLAEGKARNLTASITYAFNRFLLTVNKLEHFDTKCPSERSIRLHRIDYSVCKMRVRFGT